ncbi:Cytidine and dCMP deaminase domain-containing protein 1 [Exaiptasia diaphana]|nr:Cytidine and dCMP deaminase domain-containing protein 1 [Exaiptasia diaphana]
MGVVERVTRLSKDNLYMALALWMEEFPYFQEEDDGCKGVGVVFVLPNDRVLSVDCSRDGVHGIARVIVKHCADRVEGCKVFVSRKPCSICAKLLVQARVLRVFYLPIMPEKEEDLANVDRLFNASPVAQSMFVPHVGESLLDKIMERESLEDADFINSCQKEIFNKWWDKDSVTLDPLDENMKQQIEGDFDLLMKWIASIKTPVYKAEMKFYNVDFKGDDLGVIHNAEVTEFPGGDVAKHMMVFAKMLARQTDDPKTGVGAILMDKLKKEIVGLGWNGFPSKALYAEFPRASDKDASDKDTSDKDTSDKDTSDTSTREKKYPFVIHAEQNALMVRNEKDLKDGILFVTKCPCNECAPLVKLSGVETIVVGEHLEDRKEGDSALNYDKVRKYVKDGELQCIEMRKGDASE